jgi:molybdopterin-biosynthesis enzyme MoeA-like protein
VLRESAVVVRGVPESRLIPLMRGLEREFPDLKLFSLPHMGEDPHILLGFRGRHGLDEAMGVLRRRLDEDAIDHRDPPADAGEGHA